MPVAFYVHPVFFFFFKHCVQCYYCIIGSTFHFHQLEHRQTALTVSPRVVGHTDRHLNWPESTLTSRSHTEDRLLCLQAQPEPSPPGKAWPSHWEEVLARAFLSLCPVPSRGQSPGDPVLLLFPGSRLLCGPPHPVSFLFLNQNAGEILKASQCRLINCTLLMFNVTDLPSFLTRQAF